MTYRVLQPGGYLVHAFKIGSGGRHLANAHGHDVDLDVHTFDPADRSPDTRSGVRTSDAVPEVSVWCSRFA